MDLVMISSKLSELKYQLVDGCQRFPRIKNGKRWEKVFTNSYQVSSSDDQRSMGYERS